jgi:Beta-lactamase superfamily domain
LHGGSEMKITVLGSGSAFSSVSRFNSCYHVEAGGRKFMIDCGSDAMRAMQKAEIDFFSLEEIFVTHMHADHSAGLPAVLTGMHVLGRTEPLKIHVPYPQIDFVKLWLANMFVYEDRLSFRYSLLPLKAGRVDMGNGTELQFIGTRHLDKYSTYAAAFGITTVSFSAIVREGKRKFFFSSDLASLDEAKEYMPGGVTFLEATHPPLAEVSALAAEDRADVYFTHIPMELEDGGEWRKELAVKLGFGEINMLRDGQVIII